MSTTESASAPDSDSAVVKKTWEPSTETPRSAASNVPLPQAGAHEELGAAYAEHCGRRAHAHPLGRLLGDLSRDDRQRAAAQCRLELPGVVLRAEHIAERDPFFDAGGRLAQTHVGALTPASLDAALRRVAPPKVN